MRISIILFCEVLLLGLMGYATAKSQPQTVVSGYITTTDEIPVEQMSVKVKGTSIGNKTDQRGFYELVLRRGGQYTIQVSGVGIMPQEKVILVSEGVSQSVNFVVSLTNQQLDEVLVSANKARYKVDTLSSSLRLDIPLLEIPQNIQVVTAKAMEDQQIISMSDGLVRNVSGALKLEHWDELYARINMRGSRASAFRNGMNVTSQWGPLDEDMSMVENIEFVKGPAGFMMSNGEPSGIYNVVTKKPTGQTKGEANITMGSFDLYRATLDLDGKLASSGKLLYRFNVMGQRKNSFRNNQFNHRYSISPAIRYLIDDQTVLTAEYNYQHARMANVGSSYTFAQDGYGSLPRDFTWSVPQLEPTVIKDHSLFLHVEHQFNDDWKLTTQAAYFNYDQVGSSFWINAYDIGGGQRSAIDDEGNIIRNVSIWDAVNESTFGQAYLNGTAYTGLVRHRIMGGIDLGTKDYAADWSQGHALDTVGGFFNIYAPHYTLPANGLPNFDRSIAIRERATVSTLTQSYVGVYVQDELGFWEDRIRLTLAGRYTYVRQSRYGTAMDGNRFTPRVGISVSIDERTAVYGLFDQTFVPQTGLLRGEDLPKPITGNNIEFGAKRNWNDGKWSSGLSVYRILKNNQLVTDRDTSGGNSNFIYSLQLGRTRTQGVEVDLKGEIVEGFNIILNYAYTDAQVSKNPYPDQVGNVVPGYATHVGNGWLSYRMQRGPLKGVGLSGGFSYQKDRKTWGWDTENEKNLPDYFRLDGGVSWQNKRVILAANVFNILNEYLYSGSPYSDFYYWQSEPPRNFRVSLGYRF
ncbi:TonB-dependent receptor [Parapedobacter tibetensis]|uniref:TonB-dependent receptor n=1 Tax=Parapedobacter tibetensis TaxID=2972951 RepID=UPI00214D7589|nr:TonB-dependent receptor [Parapedobacter tibetensis]